MLVSYLATQVIALPFTSIPELIQNSNYRIAVMPGSSQEDAFKLSNYPQWAVGYTERIKPYLDEYSKYDPEWMSILDNDSNTAVYIDYFTGM
jgi:hypothetical protein